MQIYTVHYNPARGEDLELVLVREGSAWWAFWLGPIWFLFRNAPQAAVVNVLLLLLAALAYRWGFLTETFAFWAVIAVQSLAVLFALDGVRWALSFSGYKELFVVTGSDLISAERRAIERFSAEFADRQAVYPEQNAAIIPQAGPFHPRRRSLSPFAGSFEA